MVRCGSKNHDLFVVECVFKRHFVHSPCSSTLHIEKNVQKPLVAVSCVDTKSRKEYTWTFANRGVSFLLAWGLWPRRRHFPDWFECSREAVSASGFVLL